MTGETMTKRIRRIFSAEFKRKAAELVLEKTTLLSKQLLPCVVVKENWHYNSQGY
jgi:hypothetical protein